MSLLGAWLRRLPFSVPIVVLSWAPFALVTSPVQDDRGVLIVELAALGGAGTYTLLLAWTGFRWIAPVMPFVAAGALPVLLQNGATAILIRPKGQRGFGIVYSLFSIGCLGVVQLGLVTIFWGATNPLSLAAWALASLSFAWVASEFWLALPVMLFEGGGLGRALRRSIHLSRGSRLLLFTWVVLLAVLPATVAAIDLVVTGDLPAPLWIAGACVLVATLRATLLARLYESRVAIRDQPGFEEIFD